MHPRSYRESVLAIEMKNKIPSLSSTMMQFNINDYYGAQVYFFLCDIGFYVWRHSCDVINVKNFRDILKYFF